METEQETFVDQLFNLLEQLLIPNWNDLIRLLPFTLLGLILLWLLFTALQWRRAGDINRPRVAPRLAGGAPPPGVHMPGPSRWPFLVPIGAFLIFLAFALPGRDASGAVTVPFNLGLLLLGFAFAAVAVVGWLRDSMREWRATAEGGHAPVAAAVAVPTTAQVQAQTAAALPPLQQASPALVAPTTPSRALIVAPHAETIGSHAEVIAHRDEIEAAEVHHLPAPSPWPFFAPIALFMILLGFIFSAFLIVGGLVLGLIAAAGWYLEAGREYRSTEAVGHAVPATLDPAGVWPRRLLPLMAAVVAFSFLGVLAPHALTALSGLRPGPASPTPIAVPAVPEIGASTAVSFETGTLIVPCCRPFDVVFNNNHAGVQHNVEITDGPQLGQVFFDGELISGVASVTYSVPALAEGSYYFLCKVHPNMNGTVQALPETGAPPGAPPGQSPGRGSPGAPPTSPAP